MNFVFVSPHFPRTYFNFCNRLKERGVNILGIGDCPYEQLEQDVKDSLNEYYKVDSMEDYNQMLKAVAFFTFKYGKIDWLESNNEYWLPQDAQLRTDFNITSGVKSEQIISWTRKFEMKKYYAAGNVPTARCFRVTNYQETKEFLDTVGYPVIVKPDHGVGAADTWKLENDEDLVRFFNEKPDVPYVIEEFVTGDIYSYDAIVDNEGNPLFENSAVFPPSIADLVNKNLGLNYYCLKDVPEQLKVRGRATVKAFGVKSRFVHFEFFRLTKAKKGLGEVGDFVGLEVNMRPAGGYTPDMMNFAHSTDVYSVWADMIVHNSKYSLEGEQYYCAYSSRRDTREYVHTHDEILEKYGSKMVMCERMPEALSGAMGNQMYTCKFETEEEVKEFFNYVGE